MVEFLDFGGTEELFLELAHGFGAGTVQELTVFTGGVRAGDDGLVA